MPYSNPSSPAAVEPASTTRAPFSFSHRAIHRSHHHFPHHPQDHPSSSSSGSSSPAWSSPQPGPMPTVPRRASSTSSTSRAGVVSPPNAPGLVLPRRGTREKSPGSTPPRRGTPAEVECSLGLSVGESSSSSSEGKASGIASSSSSTLADPQPSSSTLEPTTLPFPSGPSPPLPSPPVRRTDSSSKAALCRAGSPSLRVDIPPPKPQPQHTLHHHARHHSHIGSSNSSSSRPPPMIRKKSGELVKPSLKSRTSYSTPNSAGPEDGEEETEDRWAMSRSAPTTPSGDSRFASERKTLRFAGGDGDEGELERVVLFKREHKVTAVTRVLAGEDLDRLNTDTETETEGAGKASFGNVWASPKYSRSSSSSSSDKEKIEIHQIESTTVPRVFGLNLDNSRGKPILVPEFDQVMLESLMLVDEGGPSGALTLKGTVVVRDITYSKWVAIRFTFDEWQTVSEVSAIHSIHIPPSALGPKNADGQGWDRFTFSVKLDDVRRKIDERHLLLAVRYSIEGGAEWWDSCDGSNYKVRFKKTKPVVAPAPVARSKSDNGGAFLPLLEAKQHHVLASPMSYHSAQTHANGNGNTHLPLPNRLPSALHASHAPNQSQSWTFPHRASNLDAHVTSPKTVPVPLAFDAPPVRPKIGASSSPGAPPAKLKNYCPPTSPPASPPEQIAPVDPLAQARFGKLAAVAGPSGGGGNGSGNGSGSSSPVRQGHHRSKSSISIGGGSKDFGSLPPPAYMRPTQSSFPPPTNTSPSKRSTLIASSVPLSPPLSASHSPPSPTDSLLATPLPNTSEVSPTVMTFDLPDLGVEASGNPKKRVSPIQKEVNLPSDSYADFIAKYCFFQGSDAISPPSSSSSSPLDRPSHLPTRISLSPPHSALSSGHTTPQQQESPHGIAQTLSFLPPAWNQPSPSSSSDNATTPTLTRPAGGVFWGTDTVSTSPTKRSPPPAAGGSGGRVIAAMRG
ncbi:putative phosphatase regulatory subunit-domain-containing protein [Mrakia frigida]|uniref:putative phosphatase regulatory subunit-domain-containing protein n=1 Tax=Mrakia frigida TaxID=29902 RepID=UPI003FCC12B8